MKFDWELNMKKIFIFLSLLMTLSACDNQNKPLAAEDLMHHRFVLAKINNNEIPIDYATFIEFGEDFTINGKMCNEFSGKLLLNNNEISTPNLSTTSLTCDNDQLNQLDAIIQKLLTNGATLTLNQQSDKTRLKLINNTDTLIFELRDLM